ncbi:MAG: DNA translocase FtsK 4TM domain-containing protein [Paludibacteraceae bacterium]
MSKQKVKNGFWQSLKRVFTDERTCFAIGIVIVVMTVYVLLAMVSFFFTGADDYSIIASDNVVPEDITNWTGYSGALIADYLINRWFGVASFVLLWCLLVVGLRLMRVKIVALWKAFLGSAFLTVWLSLLFDVAFGKLCQNIYLVPGGAHGVWLDKWLNGAIGFTGTLLLLIGTGLLFAIFAFSSTIPFLRRCFAKKEKPTDTPQTEAVENPIDDTQEPTNDTLVDDVSCDTPDSVVVELVPADDENDANNDNATDIESVSPETEPISDETAIETVDTTDTDDAVDEVYDPLVAQGPYDPTADLDDYKYPTLDLLKDYGTQTETVTREEQVSNQQRIITTLKQFGIGIQKIYETIGPTITLYEIVPEAGVRINKVRNLEADIMLSLAATGIRIIAPIPGKGTIGIEVPNSHPRIVSMHATIASKKFQESTYELPVALGRTITNEVFMFDLTKMPHLLVAGATGQGKSVGLNAIITSLLYKKHPAQLKFVLVDPKKVEFNIYADIEKHFLAKLPEADEPVITDVDEVKQTLNSICKEMDQRYDLLKIAHVRNIKEYNEKFINRRLNPDKGHRFLPYIVVIIDEFGDLIMTAGKEVEMPIARIAQLARAVGIHMVIATQRPSVNIITGIIKANFPARLAFKTSSMVDSKTILDAAGAQQLIGRGDLLFSQGNDVTRVQCAFVDTPEVEKIVQYIGEQRGYPTALILPEPDIADGDGDAVGSVDMHKLDALFTDAAYWVVQSQQGSTSMIQRKFEVGFNRAARIMDQLEAAGIVGPAVGSKPRQVLVHTEYELQQILATF